MWSDGKVVKAIKAHDTGPKIIMSDGSVTYNGVRGLVLKGERDILLTGTAASRFAFSQE